MTGDPPGLVHTCPDGERRSVLRRVLTLGDQQRVVYGCPACGAKWPVVNGKGPQE